MSAQIDRILDVLDVGLQSSGEMGYGTDHSPTQCSRCQRDEPIEGGDMCAGCRAYLLGDTDDDPSMNVRRPTLNGLEAVISAEGRSGRWTSATTTTNSAPVINHANGWPVIGGSIDGSCIAAEGHHLEVPILRDMCYRVDDPEPAMPIIERDIYRRERFSMGDRLMWAWVHSSLTPHQAAVRLTNMSSS